MPRPDLDAHFAQIDDLIREINVQVPQAGYSSVQFRADLAGMLVVAMAATYETCVKEVLFERANRQHSAFGDFTKRNYARLNSRISVSDLKKYCELFDPGLKARFATKLSARKSALLGRSGLNIEVSYERILEWRHDFAHAAIRRTTIEEAAATHRVAKRVLYTFEEAMAGP